MNVDLGGGGEEDEDEDEEGNCDAVCEGIIIKPCHFVARTRQGHTYNTAECEAVWLSGTTASPPRRHRTLLRKVVGRTS